MSLSKEEDKRNRFEKLLSGYTKLLQEKPILTKSITSGSVSGLGNFLSQLIVPVEGKGGKIVWRSVFSYAAFGFFVSGPLIHHLYILIDKLIPRRKDSSLAIDGIKRVILDRFIFTPPFILLFLYVVTILEGHGHEAAITKIKETYWTILKLNWRIWTIFQFINVNYVPQKYRVLFGNGIALFWSIFIAIKRRQMMSS